ncbi:MAG: hypothetical protein WBG41_17120, partial [Acidimicrobiales bacterium]
MGAGLTVKDADQAGVKLPVCQPIAVELTGPGLGGDPSAGAEQLAKWVWAPYQVAVPGACQTSQHNPPAERVASVTA